MAYFSNGTEGEVLDIQCSECLHRDPSVACPIAFVQMFFNYEQVGNKDLEKCLNELVDKDGKCKMKPLIDGRIPKDTQLDLWE